MYSHHVMMEITKVKHVIYENAYIYCVVNPFLSVELLFLFVTLSYNDLTFLIELCNKLLLDNICKLII